MPPRIRKPLRVVPPVRAKAGPWRLFKASLVTRFARLMRVPVDVRATYYVPKIRP